MARKIITIIGSLNTDLVTLTPRVPAGGETLTASSFSTGPGGKGANQAVACARLSRLNPALSKSKSASTSDLEIQVKMIGAVGDDEFGPSLIASLQASTIDTTSIHSISQTSTGVAVILVESTTGENRILLSPGANHSLQPTSFQTPSSLGSTPPPSLLVLQLEIPLPTVLQILRTAHSAPTPIPTLLNPAPAVPLPDDIYPCITHLILNESEAAILKGIAIESVLQSDFNWRSVTDWFLNKGVRSVIVTLGAKGAIFAMKDVYENVSAEKDVKVVDTTAAGDTFVGAYAVELVRNEGKEDPKVLLAAVVKACKAAARTVEKEGAQSAIPWADEVER